MRRQDSGRGLVKGDCRERLSSLAAVIRKKVARGTLESSSDRTDHASLSRFATTTTTTIAAAATTATATATSAFRPARASS